VAAKPETPDFRSASSKRLIRLIPFVPAIGAGFFTRRHAPDPARPVVVALQ